MCINTASRARDGDPRSAPVALVGYTTADTPDPPVPLLRACATSREPIAFLWSAPRRYDACATKVIVRRARAGPRLLGMLNEKSEVTHKRDYADLSNLELVQLLAKEARELELLEHPGQVLDAEALD